MTSPPTVRATRLAMARPRPDPVPVRPVVPGAKTTSAWLASSPGPSSSTRISTDPRCRNRRVIVTGAGEPDGVLDHRADRADGEGRGHVEPGVGRVDRHGDAGGVDRLDDLAEHGRQRAARRREHGRLVARQVEQCRDRAGHPLAGRRDLLEVPGGLRRQRVAQEHEVGHALDGRQRGAQLVRELRRQPLLGADRRRHLVQQLVERRGQGTDLVVGRSQVEAPGEVVLAPLRRRLRHHGDRLQRSARRPGGDRRGRQRRQDSGHQAHDECEALGLLVRFEALGDDHDTRGAVRGENGRARTRAASPTSRTVVARAVLEPPEVVLQAVRGVPGDQVPPGVIGGDPGVQG